MLNSIIIELRNYVLSSNQFSQKLFTIYLINEILVYSNNHKEKNIDINVVLKILYPQLPIIFHNVYHSTLNDDDKNKIKSIIDLWINREMYIYIIIEWIVKQVIN